MTFPSLLRNSTEDHLNVSMVSYKTQPLRLLKLPDDYRAWKFSKCNFASFELKIDTVSGLYNDIFSNRGPSVSKSVFKKNVFYFDAKYI